MGVLLNKKGHTYGQTQHHSDPQKERQHPPSINYSHKCRQTALQINSTLSNPQSKQV